MPLTSDRKMALSAGRGLVSNEAQVLPWRSRGRGDLLEEQDLGVRRRPRRGNAAARGGGGLPPGVPSSGAADRALAGPTVRTGRAFCWPPLRGLSGPAQRCPSGGTHWVSRGRRRGQEPPLGAGTEPLGPRVRPPTAGDTSLPSQTPDRLDVRRPAGGGQGGAPRGRPP